MSLPPARSKDHSGCIGKDDSFGEVCRVDDLGTSKTAIDHTVLGKILGQSLPETDG